MEEIIYIRCRNPEMTYIDPKTKFKIPRGKIVEHPKKLTRTMQRWVRRGGIKIVDKALYLKQQEAEPKVEEKKPVKEVGVSIAEPKNKIEKEATPKATAETPNAEPEKEPETKPEDKTKETQPKKPKPEEEQPKEKEEAVKPARKPRKPDKK